MMMMMIYNNARRDRVAYLYKRYKRTQCARPSISESRRNPFGNDNGGNDFRVQKYDIIMLSSPAETMRPGNGAGADGEPHSAD